MSPSNRLLSSTEDNRPLMLNHSSPHFKDTSDLISVTDENPIGTTEEPDYQIQQELSELEGKYLGPNKQTSSEQGTSEGLRSETRSKKFNGFKAFARSGGLLRLSRQTSNAISLGANSTNTININRSMGVVASRSCTRMGKTASFLRRNYEQFKHKSISSDLDSNYKKNPRPYVGEVSK